MFATATGTTKRDRSDSRGFMCPTCGTHDCKVIDSRFTKTSYCFRRRRECANGHRYTTREYVEDEMSGFDPII